MKALISCVVIMLLAVACMAVTMANASDVYVNGYTKANGTHVDGYHRSSPNNTTLDNYSEKGLR